MQAGMEDKQHCFSFQTWRSWTCYWDELFLTAQLDFFKFPFSFIEQDWQENIAFTQFHFWWDLGILKGVWVMDLKHGWITDGWKTAENEKKSSEPVLLSPLPRSLVVLSALNAATHFQWVTIEMIIAVAVVKNVAQNLRDSTSMADMQSRGKKDK